MTNLILDLALHLGLARAQVPVLPAAAANQEAVTQEVVLTLAVSQTLIQRNPKKSWKHQTSPILMEQR